MAALSVHTCIHKLKVSRAKIVLQVSRILEEINNLLDRTQFKYMLAKTDLAKTD